MDSTRIETRIGIRASAERIWELVGDLEAWKQWNSFEQHIQGRVWQDATVTYTEAYPDIPERAASVVVSDWVPVGKLVLSGKRGFLSNSSRFIILEEVEKGATIVTMGIMFSGLRGELFHDKYRSRLRQAMETLNENLKAAAESA